ncbi:hypothetical protein [Microbacterium algeriense]|uniref:hypothetical protein n=1 Tax=Microbacterium algeriense TaxID=2615184 RepID=UPI0002F2E13D|nr:hypothetical protein [Microbacterium barkeri]
MLSPDDLEELRSLQERAYGRDAGLTAAEAERLRELEERRFSRPPETTDAADATLRGPVGSERITAAETGEAGAGHAAPLAEEHADSRGQPIAPDPGLPDTASRSSARALLRRHWRPAALIAAASLLAGVGIGWAASAVSAPAPVALTAEQQEWQNDLLASGDYDSGSVRAVAVEEGTVVWTATKDERSRTCLILSTGDVTQPSCDRTETVATTGIYGSITVDADDDRQRQVAVQMLLTAAGEPAVAVSAYDYETGISGITYANDEEALIAERLVDDGFDANSLWVVGYDDDVPVWSGIQTETQNPCLIYGGSAPDDPVTCADPETMQEESSSLVLNVVDAETGGVTHLEMRSNRGPTYLVITREEGVVGAGGD